MERRRCGQAGLTLSVLWLGCWSFGGGEYWGEGRQQDIVDRLNIVTQPVLDKLGPSFDYCESVANNRTR